MFHFAFIQSQTLVDRWSKIWTESLTHQPPNRRRVSKSFQRKDLPVSSMIVPFLSRLPTAIKTSWHFRSDLSTRNISSLSLFLISPFFVIFQNNYGPQLAGGMIHFYNFLFFVSFSVRFRKSCRKAPTAAISKCSGIWIKSILHKTSQIS